MKSKEEDLKLRLDPNNINVINQDIKIQLSNDCYFDIKVENQVPELPESDDYKLTCSICPRIDTNIVSSICMYNLKSKDIKTIIDSLNIIYAKMYEKNLIHNIKD